MTHADRRREALKTRRQPRPMVGLFSSLTPEQQAAILAYGGPESFGPPREMTAEERSEMERLTLRVHAEFSKILRR